MTKSTRQLTWSARAIRKLDLIAAPLVRAVRATWPGFRRRDVPVEVLVVDRVQRRLLERELQAGLRQLRRALGEAFPAQLAVVVQQAVRGERHLLPGCYQVAQRPDGTRFALVRLGLQVGDRRLGADELLAVLAEGCIGLAVEHYGGPTVRVPIELEAPPASGEATRHATLPPDPLAPRSNGQVTLPRERTA